MRILITGVAGFIGFHLSLFLLKKKYKIIGIDFIRNQNDFKINKKRLKILLKYKNFKFINQNLAKNNFNCEQVNCIIHLAAYAGVYKSFKNPYKYLRNNILSFQNIIDYGYKNEIPLIYASSSSVYNIDSYNLNENKPINQQNNIYSITKFTNEQVANVYLKKYGYKSVGLRFFSIYGPWGRPDMAYFIFSQKLKNNKLINLYNYGQDMRDFTFIDDILKPINYLIKNFNKIDNLKKVYNIGNNNPVKIINLVKIIASHYNKKPRLKYLEKRVGEALKTKANILLAKKDLNFQNKTSIDNGMKVFLKWFDKFN
tara:strand:+ start:699 stop:1637 length:939 start_codon:yes stop_codon:yes gene_type:complete